MCVFTKPIEWVGGTSIFARRVGADRQVLVYEMSFSAPEPLAMVLPIPTPAEGAAEDDVRFIDFREEVDFFSDLRRAFERESWWSRFRRWRQRRRGIDVYEAGVDELRPLVVHEIGHFEASFVPTHADFARLDDRFQVEESVWRHLGRYQDYGFAVFKLRPGKWTAHPMAFEFTTRRPSHLFFPTVHVHDGKVHPLARFDHELFAQGMGRRWRWRRTRNKLLPRSATQVLDESPDGCCRRRAITGFRRNKDLWARCG